jgi:hypothetical protein
MPFAYHRNMTILTDFAKNPGPVLRQIALAGVCLLAPGLAHAALGETFQSSAPTATEPGGTSALADAKFTVHETRAASGTTVKEFVSPSGVVFAITWRGPVMPDLQQALGRYFERYTAGDNHNGGLHRRMVNESDLVVQSSGRMRAFIGRAYVPQLLPAGVTVDQIQ